MLLRLATAIVLFAGSSLAATPEPGTVLGTDLSKISAALEAGGYRITDYRRHPAISHVIAAKDGQRHDIRLSTRSGAVVSHRSHPSGGPGGLQTVADQTQTGNAQPAPAAILTDAELVERLAAEGYEVLRLEHEGSRVEAYARRDGITWEVYVDATTGQILKAELED